MGWIVAAWMLGVAALGWHVAVVYFRYARALERRLETIDGGQHDEG